MADKKFSITFDVNANVAPMKSAIGDLKGALNNLKIPDNFKRSIETTITTLEKEITNFESLASKGFSNIGDFNKANKSAEKITNLFSKLGIQVKNLKGIDPNKFLPQETLSKTQSLQQAWLKLKQTVEKGLGNTAAIDKQNKAIADQQQKVENLQASYDKLKQENISMGSTKGNLTNSLKADRAEAEKLVAKMKELESVKGGKNTAEYKQMNSQLTQLNASIARTEKQYDELDGKIAKNKATMAGLDTGIKTSTTNLENLKQELIKLTKAASKTPEGLQEIRQKLADLKGVSIDEVSEDIDEIGEEISSLNTSQLEQIKSSFTNLNPSMEKCDKAAETLGDSMHTLGDEYNYAQERARDLANIANQVKQFFSIGNTVQLFKRAIRSAFDTIKELDAVMTQTAVVTDFSVGDMWNQLPEYTKRANELGVSVKGAYEAATLYYQQGLDTNQVIGVSNETLKMAKIAAIDYATATDYMTSALRGFNMEVNEDSARRVNDIYSELAARTAADTEEISIAMSKTAPLAHNAGMEIETTAAFLSQAIETTREAPETIGTALKTVIARFQELKKDPALIEPVEGEIVDANKIEGALRTIGVALRDTEGQFRDLDDVFLEISQKWDGLDTNTQRYIATVAAGSRQQSRFIAMMANYDRTMELVEMANNSAGASQQQFEKTLDSMQSKLDRLKNAWNEFTMGLANNSVIKAVVDALTGLLNVINKISSGLSGNNGFLKSLFDIGILAGSLKAGRSIFNGFFSWLQGKSKVEGQNIGGNLVEGIGRVFGKNGQGKGGLLSKLLGTGMTTSMSNWLDGINSQLDKRFTKVIANRRKVGNQILYNYKKVANPYTMSELFGLGKKGLKDTADKTGKALSPLKKKFTEIKIIGQKAGSAISKAFQLVPAPIKAAAVAVGVLALAIKGIKENSIEAQIERAKESTKKAQETATETKEVYDNLLSGQTKYNELQTTLDDLTYGTREWKEALIEANGQVLELIQNFPQLTQYLENGENGRLQISAEGWDTVIAQQQDAIRRTTNNVLGAQIYETNLENEKLFKDLKKSTGIFGKNALEELIKQYENNPSFFAKDSEGNYSQDLEQFHNIYGYNIDKIYAAQDAIREYEAAIQSNGAVINSYVDSLISNNENIEALGTELANTVKEAYSETVGEDYNRRYKEELGKLLGNKDVASNMNQILDEYDLEVTGNARKKLQAVYKHLAGLTGEAIDDSILDDKNAMREAIARMRIGDQIEEGLDQLAEIVDNDTSGSVQKILDILAGNFEDFSSAGLEDLGEASKGSMKDFAKSMGLSEEELSQVLDSMGYTWTDFSAKFGESTEVMIEQIKKAKIDLIQAMLDSGAFNSSRQITNRLDGLSDQQISSLAGISGQISGLSKEAQGKILSDLPILFKNGYQEEIENLFNDIDFSNPIEALNSLQDAAENGSEKVKSLAQSIIEMEPELLGAGNLFKELTQSAEFDQIDEQLKELVKDNKKITPENINNLAQSSSKLNRILKTGVITAGALAKAFTAVNLENVPIESFTSRVLEALSATKSLEEVLYEAQEFWSNFDPGMDEGQFSDYMSNAIDAMKKITEKGQYGNTALEGYLRGIYGADNLELSLDYNERKNQIDSMISQLEQWQAGDGLGFITDVYERFGDELFTIGENGEAILNVGTQTTEELVTHLAEAMNVSEEYAASQLALYSAHTPRLKAALAENDFNAQIAKLTENDGDELATITEQELEAFAVATGKKLEDVRAEVQKNGIVVTDFINKDTGIGAVGDELVGMIEDQLKGADGSFNFLKDLKLEDAFSFGETENGTKTLLLNIDKIKERLEELGLTAEQINSIFESDSFNNWVQGAKESVEEISTERHLGGHDPDADLEAEVAEVGKTLLTQEIEVPVKAVDADTGEEYLTVKKVEVAADSVENLQKAVDLEMEAADANLLAEKIVNQDYSGLAGSITDVIQSASKSGAQDLKNKIDNIKLNNKNLGVTLTYTEKNKPALLTIMGYAKGTSINLDSVWSQLPSNNKNKNITNQISNNFKDRTPGSGGRPTRASGTKFGGLKHSEIALTGEEGYELAYDSHGAFLLGENGPEIAKLEKGTVIYPHELSKKILRGYSKSIFPNHKTGTIPNHYAGEGSVIGGYTNEQWAEVGYSSIASDSASIASSWEDTASAAKDTADAVEDVAEETEEVKNDIDFLYNKTQEINNLLRQREKLERQYQRLLKTHTATGDQLKQITDEEIAKLQKRQEEERKMIELRKKELHTYMMLNKEMMKYAIIDNWDDMTIHIAWDTIDSITDKDEYEKMKDFLNELEKVVGEIQDLDDDVEDIEDDLIELKNRGEDEYRDLEDRVLDALIKREEEKIDAQEETNKAITDAKNDLIDSIKTNIDKMRQDRKNEETETSLAEKERRLAYLRQDTTGSNALEIKKLEKELRDERQDYTDSLIDQAIDDMKEEADKAAEQRDEQIEMLRKQLEWQEKTGYWADEATRIVQEGLAAQDYHNTEMYELLYGYEGVTAMSNASQKWWEQTLSDTVAQAQNWLNGQNQAAEGIGSNTDYMAQMITALNNGDFETFASLEGQRNEKIKTQGLQNEFPETQMYSSYQAGRAAKIDPNIDYMAKVNEAANSGKWADVFTYAGMRDAKIAGTANSPYKVDESFLIAFNKWYETTKGKKFATGGLADFTGPAWLDGSKSKPEMVLNPEDTKNFIELKNLLAGMNLSSGTSDLMGDWYFNIAINVDKIDSDYDVDKVAARVKQSIYNEATYRNTNAINFLK